MPRSYAPALENDRLSANESKGIHSQDVAGSHPRSPQASISSPRDQTVLRERSRRRKLVRAQQACNRCRKKKAKCDGLMPSCSRCNEYDAQCVYNRLPAMSHTLEDIGNISRDVAILRDSTEALVAQSLFMCRLLKNHRLPSPYRGVTFANSPLGLKASDDLEMNHNKQVSVSHFQDVQLKDEISCWAIPDSRSSTTKELLTNWPWINTFCKGPDNATSVLRAERDRGLFTSHGRILSKDPINKSTDDILPEGSHQRHAFLTQAVYYRSPFGWVGSTEHPGTQVAIQNPHDIFDKYLRHIHALHPFIDIKHARKIIDAVGDPEYSSRVFPATNSTRSFPYSKWKQEEHEVGDGRSTYPGSRCAYSKYQDDLVTPQEGYWVRILDEASALLLFALGTLSESDFATRSSEHPPGIEFYTRATGLLGMFTGSIELQYVHALLLAGLYVGQLVRPLESWRWINNASVTMSILLRQTPMVQNSACTDSNLDALRLTFWACFQLESDLIAVLDVPQSNIHEHVNTIPLPTASLGLRDSDQGGEADTATLFYYLEQIKLRKIINNIQSSLFSAERLQTMGRQCRIMDEKLLCESLDSWRDSLPLSLTWMDQDSPTTNVNDARLRASYYRARYLLKRPYLHWIVHNCGESDYSACEEGHGPSHIHKGKSSGDSDPVSKKQSPKLTLQICGRQSTIAFASYCIEYAVKNVEALDGVIGIPGTLASAEIFGAIQDQFTNLLVLASAFHCAEISHLVPRERLGSMLDKGITILSMVAPLSATIQTNVAVLKEIKRNFDFKCISPC